MKKFKLGRVPRDDEGEEIEEEKSVPEPPTKPDDD